MKNSRQLDMTTGALLPKIIRFSTAIMLTNLLQLLFNTADLVVVGRYGSQNSLAAVGSTGPLVTLFVNLFIGLAIGVSVTCSHAYGSGDIKGLKQTVGTSVLCAFIAGIFVGAAGVAFSEPMLRLMATPENILGLSAVYMRIYFIGMPAVMVMNYAASAIRAVGNTRDPMMYMVAAGVLNIALNLFFVIVCGLDVAGVAIATVVSETVSAVLFIVHLFRADAPYKIGMSDLHIHKDKLVKILKIGIPTGIHSTIFSLSNVLIQSSQNTFGEIAVAGSAAAANIEQYVYQIETSFYQAALNFTGQNYGAGKYKRITRIMLICFACVTVTGLTTGCLAYVFGHPLLSIYIPASETSEQAIAFGLERMLMISVPYFLCGLMEVVTGSLRGMGRSVVPTVMSVVGVCGLRVLWIFTVFRKYHTLTVLYMSYPVSWAVSFAALLVFYIAVRSEQNKKLRRRVSADG